MPPDAKNSRSTAEDPHTSKKRSSLIHSSSPPMPGGLYLNVTPLETLSMSIRSVFGECL